jgi:hypothetical protein
MAIRSRGGVSRRIVLAALPAGVFAGTAARGVLAQPAAADAVSFYLGQVLALATLQAQAVGRLRPLLASPNTADLAWQSGASAEAGVIGAVASVLGAMEPPPELTASVGELRLASAAYLGAADAARAAVNGDAAALQTATAGLAEGATHILLWLDALTAETANDWGDGLRTLTAVAAAPVDNSQPAAEATADEPPEADAATEPVPEAPPAEEAVVVEQEQAADRGGRNRRNRRERNNQDQASEE